MRERDSLGLCCSTGVSMSRTHRTVVKMAGASDSQSFLARKPSFSTGRQVDGGQPRQRLSPDGKNDARRAHLFTADQALTWRVGWDRNDLDRATIKNRELGP